MTILLSQYKNENGEWNFHCFHASYGPMAESHWTEKQLLNKNGVANSKRRSIQRFTHDGWTTSTVCT